MELEEPSLAILGTAHPDALMPALRRDDGGVLARFLFVRPVPSADYRPLSGAEALVPEAIAALRRLYERPWDIHDLSLTGEAHVAFDRFRRTHCAPMPDLAGKEAAWWGKGPSQVLRLAGVLTFLDWAAQPTGTAEPEQVPAWAVESAVRLWRDHLWPHAQATFRIAGTGGERESRQRQVLRWLAKQRLPEVSREHIRREALSQAIDAAGADRLIDDLVEAGCLRPVEPAKGGRGRRHRRWHVHPELLLLLLGARHSSLPSPAEAGFVPLYPPEAGFAKAGGASPGAAAEGDLRPLDLRNPTSAIPASEFSAATVAVLEQVDPAAAPTVPAICGAPGELARSSRWKTGTGKEVAFRLVASVARVRR